MKNLTQIRLSLLVVLLNAITVHAEIKLPAILGDNMVLQQETKAPIWGWAEPGEKITLFPEWSHKQITTIADNQGNWMVRLKTPKAGGAYTLRIEGLNTIILKNILIGEVWLCSGQSNMEMPLQGWQNQPVQNSEEEIRTANFPEMRIFTVEKNTSLKPLKDVKGRWEVVSSESIRSFSATAYFFGKELHKNLNLPIGLIHTSWGGTVAEAWTSEKALRDLKDFDEELDKMDSIQPHLDEVIANGKKQKKEFEEQIKNPPLEFLKASVNTWESMTVPSIWEENGYKVLDGIVWFRTTVNIPENWQNKDLILKLGPIDDIDITWFNGEKIGETKEEGFYWAKEREYNIPGSIVRSGMNQIAVRVVDLGGSGGIYGTKDQLQLYPAESGEKKAINLSGKWKIKIEKEAPVVQFSENPNRPAALYNAMIAPLIPFTIKGAIWYQGESNVGRADQYAKLFPLMIRNWRNVWNEGDFPFYFAQIAPFEYMGDGTQSAALRNAQRISSNKVKNADMAVLLDVGSMETIHPPNKEEVGRRLSLLALKNTYGHSIIATGPTVDKLKIKNHRAIVIFKNAQGGLVAGDSGLNNFEIAGKDGLFFPADAKVEGKAIVLQAKEVSNPFSVRYAWKDKAVAQLFNEEGLPASTFLISVKE